MSNRTPPPGRNDPDAEPASETAPFGFRDVAPGRKAALVNAVFSSVAGRYDLMNDLMSGGLHRLWKRRMVAAVRPVVEGPVLDLAGGTGDIADRLSERSGDSQTIAVCDINPAMLAIGREKSWNKGHLASHHWVCGDAERLPFAASAFAACTMAFGIRNVTRIDRALADIARVLKPGGQFICLEFSPDVLPLLKPLYERFSFAVIPRLGQLVTGDADAYRYLVESIRRFPANDAFAALIRENGFSGVRVRPFNGGIVTLTTAWRV